MFGKYINKYYVKYSYLFLIGIIFLIGVDIVQLMLPEALGTVVDTIENTTIYTDEIKNKLLWESLKILFAGLGIFLGRIVFRVTIFRASTRADIGIGEQLFNKSLKLDLNFYHNNKIGSLMSYYTIDIENIQDFFGWGTIQIIDASFLLIYTIVKMFLSNIFISIVIIIPIIFIGVWGALVEKYMVLIYEQRQDAYSKIYDFTQESFTGIRVIKAFVKETSQVLLFSKLAKKNQEMNVKFGKFYFIFDLLLRIIIALVSSLILGVGGFLVYLTVNGTPFVIFNQEITFNVGSLVTYLGYFTILIWPVIAFGQTITMFSRAKTSSKRITNFLDAPEDIKDDIGEELTDVKGKIEIRNLSFSYPNTDVKSLDNINLTINPGEHIGIIGKIGSGKSTFINLLVHLYNIDKNSILIDDVDLMDINVNSLRKNIALVPQDNFLFNATIEDNIKVGKDDASKEEIIESLKKAAVLEDINNFPQKEETQIQEKGVSLSGGQKQRISIARAFIKNAPIMILDDSLNAVDTKTELDVLNTIKEYRKDKTTIFVSSRVSTIKDLDKVIVFNEGKLEAFDTPDNLMKTTNTFSKMYILQKLEMEI